MDFAAEIVTSDHEKRSLLSGNKEMLSGNKEILSGNKEILSGNKEILITEIMRKIGIPAKLKGYYYLRSAILCALESEEWRIGITTKLYPVIAEQYGVKPSQVERDIRNCLSAAHSRGNKDAIDDLFKNCSAKNRISNKRFIATIVDQIVVGN